MTDRTRVPTSGPAVADTAPTADELLRRRVLELEEENARLARERLEYLLLGEKIAERCDDGVLTDLDRQLRDVPRRSDVLREGRIVPPQAVPPEAVLDLAELFEWRRTVAAATGLCTGLFLREGRGRRPVDDGARDGVCMSRCVDGVAGLLDQDTERRAAPYGTTCPTCAAPLWLAPIVLSHADDRVALGLLAGHDVAPGDSTRRKLVELLAALAGRRASDEYARQAAVALHLQVTAMVARHAEEKERAAESAREARAAAERANRSKSMFLAAMSHEIRTPLTCVIGFADLLTLPTLGEKEVREFAASIKESGQVLLSLINNVLDLSRIEAGRLDVERIPYSARGVLEEVCGIFAPSSREKGVPVELTVDSVVPEEQIGDPVRLRQVVMNLVGNALKFTLVGRVEVSCRPAPTNGWLEVAVADTGVGIPADRLETIFEAFQQADSGTARRHGGSGLGLAIARKTVQAMGGALVVESEVDRGSRFTFTFPNVLPGSPAEDA